VPTHERPPRSDALRLLAEGDVAVEGRLPWSSNATFVVNVCLNGVASRAVYKPYRGERELWDFPDGLFPREVAAFQLSELLGWGIVPETVMRDGPFGPGSLQRFVDADFSEHYFTLLERQEHADDLRTIATFDLLANNADRKSGHCLLAEGRVWAIDHGLCFHSEPKLRTVMWDFAGEPIPERLLSDIERVTDADELRGLGDMLSTVERDALAARARAVLKRPHFPDPNPSRRSYPWPLV
jgi:uncharacterized repeat protein (TIGR03843 family)